MAAGATYLGLDIGTSGVKAVLIGEDQTILASETSPLSVSRPHSGWSEQEADHWIAATIKAIAAVKSAVPEAFATLTGIGLSGQQHGATLLGADDKPLRPCILWNDGRSQAECAELDALADYQGIGGNIIMPGFTAPKLRWVQKHEPEIFAKTKKVLLPKDYVRLWLTGNYVSDMSDSAGTLWLDVAARKWSPELLSASDLTLDHMPSLVEGSESSGTLRSQLASEWGVSASTIVAGGGGDNAASACGLGVVTPDTAFVSLGTSGVVFVSNEHFSPNTAGAVHAMCHAIPDTWHQMGVILSAMDSLTWLSGITGTSAPDLTSALEGDLGAPGSGLFLPYLSGERTPHNDSGARGAFIGLDHNSDKTVLTRLVLEGIAFAVRDSVRVLSDAGSKMDSVLVAGGGGRSKALLKILASVLNIDLLLPEAGDFGGGFGAARL
ncbi:MAG: xylulokinase, partial [Rhizobiales bacterium]|nr:xylulokinase [Hyphomicrobiales bacterium]